MSGNLFLDMAIWFFAIAGFLLLLCDVVRFFIYKDTLPEKLTVLIPAETLTQNARGDIAGLINLLYAQNPDGQYELIVLDNAHSLDLKKDLNQIADATECVFIADTGNVAEYIKQSFK